MPDKPAERWTPPAPRTKPPGFPVAPYFYPRFLRHIADVLDSLNDLNRPDPEGNENQYYVPWDPSYERSLPVYEDEDDDVDERPPVGWLTQVDHSTWVFVPYVKEIEEADGG